MCDCIRARAHTTQTKVTTTKEYLHTHTLSLALARSLEMGGFLSQPKTEKEFDSGVCVGLRYGAAAMQGWRVEMEVRKRKKKNKKQKKQKKICVNVDEPLHWRASVGVDV